MKKAVITGITGQDGSYLAELLLSKGYEVHGIIRRASTFNTSRIDHIYEDPHVVSNNLFIHHGDLSDPGKMLDLVYNIKPEEIYHLGAQSHVRVSFEIPEYTGNINALGTLRLLEAVRRSGLKTRFYQASSSEMFGLAPAPQNEKTVFHPRSPYAASKAYAHWTVINYRESYCMFACNGILFNHESPRRGETFLPRKVTRGIARIKSGLDKKIYLGNLDARRDWGFAPEYVECMWRILQQDEPDDYVIGTGESHSVREFVEEAFGYADMDWKKYIETDPRYYRPAEVDFLKADITKAKKKLGWEPKIKFHDLIKIMVDYDLEFFGLPSKGEGKHILQGKDIKWTQSKVVRDNL